MCCLQSLGSAPQNLIDDFQTKTPYINMKSGQDRARGICLYPVKTSSAVNSMAVNKSACPRIPVKFPLAGQCSIKKVSAFWFKKTSISACSPVLLAKDE